MHFKETTKVGWAALAATATTKTVAQPELNDRGRDRARG
jgi:hypothetical protein